MSWFYAENDERRGPVDDAAFQDLVAKGTIKPSTLVWREGMADWMPYSGVQAKSGEASEVVTVAGPLPSETASGATGGPAKMCTQCSRIFAADELIVLAGRPVCAGCKPLVIQQMMEGTESGGTSIDPEAFIAELRARGGYRLELGPIISRAWNIMMANFWPCVGVTFLIWVIFIFLQSIPVIGIAAAFILNGPLFGGLCMYFLKQFRGEPVVSNDAFVGFDNAHFGRLAMAGTVQTFVSVALVVLFVGPGMIFDRHKFFSESDELPWTLIIGCLALIPPSIYFGLSWLFAFVLIVDRHLDFWPALELSRRVIGMQFWGWLGLGFLSALLYIAGFFVLCGGFFVAMALCYCGLMVAYEDIFSQRQKPAP